MPRKAKGRGSGVGTSLAPKPNIPRARQGKVKKKESILGDTCSHSQIHSYLVLTGTGGRPAGPERPLLSCYLPSLLLSCPLSFSSFMASVLILGTAGIGGALARRLFAKSVPLILCGRSEEKLSALKSAMPGVETHTLDCSDPSAVERVVKGLASKGPLRGLVYAVGSIPLKPLKSTSPEDFLSTYNLNFLSAAMAVKSASPALSGHSVPGSIVLFSTVAAAVGFPNHCAIASAKGALEAFTRSSAAELSPKIRVNCIAPSLMDTPLASRMTSNEAVKKGISEAHPIPRLGTAEEGAALAEFLLNDESSGWMTGQVIALDGGRSTLRPKN